MRSVTAANLLCALGQAHLGTLTVVPGNCAAVTSARAQPHQGRYACKGNTHREEQE